MLELGIPAPTTHPRGGAQVPLAGEIFFAAGAILFVLIVALGSMLLTSRAAGNLTWALVLPSALIACAVYTSIRHWRCPHCGTYLPTTSAGLSKRECQRYGRPFEL